MKNGIYWFQKEGKIKKFTEGDKWMLTIQEWGQDGAEV